MRNLSTFNWIALILVVIGGINWGLVGLFNFNLVAAIFGEATMLSRIIYDLIGLAAILVGATLGSFGRKME